jgi:hypothetical protein
MIALLDLSGLAKPYTWHIMCRDGPSRNDVRCIPFYIYVFCAYNACYKATYPGPKRINASRGCLRTARLEALDSCYPASTCRNVLQASGVFRRAVGSCDGASAGKVPITVWCECRKRTCNFCLSGIPSLCPQPMSWISNRFVFSARSCSVGNWVHFLKCGCIQNQTTVQLLPVSPFIFHLRGRVGACPCMSGSVSCCSPVCRQLPTRADGVVICTWGLSYGIFC